MIDEPRIVSLQVGIPERLGVEGAEHPMDRPWVTSLFKQPAPGPLWLGRTNLAGDRQADLEHHGGPDKAVCVYPAAHYPWWARDLGVSELPFGAFGENFTVAGMTEADACIGDIWAVGDAVVQLSQPRAPCWKLARRWRTGDLAARAQAAGFTGWYLRVLKEGEVRAGLPLELRERPCGEWTVARANDVMHRFRHDRDAARRLAGCPFLSTGWRAALEKRAEGGEDPDTRPRMIGPNADGEEEPDPNPRESVG